MPDLHILGVVLQPVADLLKVRVYLQARRNCVRICAFVILRVTDDLLRRLRLRHVLLLATMPPTGIFGHFNRLLHALRVKYRAYRFPRTGRTCGFACAKCASATSGRASTFCKTNRAEGIAKAPQLCE